MDPGRGNQVASQENVGEEEHAVSLPITPGFYFQNFQFEMHISFEWIKYKKVVKNQTELAPKNSENQREQIISK